MDKISNPALEAAGLNAYGEKPVVSLTPDEQLTDLDQKLPEAGVPGGKIKELSVDKLTAGTMRVDTYIQSTGFEQGVSGWRIDGDGNAQFNSIALTAGAVTYGKTSFTDSVNAGYSITADGVYFGAANDASFVKYDIAASEITMVGTYQTALGTGERIEIASGTNDLRVFKANGAEMIKIGGDGNSTAMSVYLHGAADLNALYIEKDGLFSAIDIRVLGTSGVAGGIYVRSEGGTCIELEQHNNTRALFATCDAITPGNGGVIEASVNVGAGVAGSPALLGRVASGDAIAVFATAEQTTGWAYPLHCEQNAPMVPDIYKVSAFNGAGAVNLSLYVANNVSPNGTLSGNAGDLCMSSDGNLYRCTGGTTWVTC